MVNLLSEGYKKALDVLSKQVPAEIIVIVETIIELKHMASALDLLVKTNVEDSQIQSKIIDSVSDMLATSLATTCAVNHLSFDKDILPLVLQVTNEASTGSHLQ
jgi:hypothetical protein